MLTDEIRAWLDTPVPPSWPARDLLTRALATLTPPEDVAGAIERAEEFAALLKLFGACTFNGITISETDLRTLIAAARVRAPERAVTDAMVEWANKAYAIHYDGSPNTAMRAALEAALKEAGR